MNDAVIKFMPDISENQNSIILKQATKVSFSVKQTELLLKPLFDLIRLEHWIKNLLLFFPLIFAGRLLEVELIAKTFLGFLAFSLVASSVYILNDWRDLDFDRQHPKKKLRTLASGAISNQAALCISLLLLLLGSGACFLVGSHLLLLLLGYFALNLLYTFWLKDYAIVDISVVSSGYILRVFAGGIIGGIFISHWLIIMTFLTAMFLLLAKRRSDLVLLENGNGFIRKSMHGYNMQFTNVALPILGSVIIVAYIMYTVSAEVTERVGSVNLYITTVPVLIGILRYLQLTIVENDSADPVKVLLKDRMLLAMISIWLCSFLIILYGKKIFAA